MKKYAIACILVMQSLFSFAQQNEISQLGCATVTTPQELQEVYDFVKNQSAWKTTATVDTLPLTIHIIGQDDGEGKYRLDHLFQVLCKLNDHFAPVGFYFYIQWPINYIDNSSFFEHDYWGGQQMMSNNVPNTVNVYFVGDPSGNCGYYSPGGGAVAIRNSCADPKSTTLTHELGHYFGLPHTFSGWENGNTPSNPEKVTRGAGANCSTAGDGFCDTDADFLSARWNCPYTGIKTDVNGDPYHPDSSMYMSYSTDACMTRFSQQQMARMQARLAQNYASLKNGTPPPYTILDYPTLKYPTDSIYSNYKVITWDKVAGAEYYHVKITQMGVVRLETVTPNTYVNLDFNLAQNNTYNLNIAPLNAVNLCRAKMVTKNMIYTNSTTVLNIPELGTKGELSITPNPVTNGHLQLHMTALPQASYAVNITSISGQTVYHTSFNHTGGDDIKYISLPAVPAGMYFVQVKTADRQWTLKLMVQ